MPVICYWLMGREQGVEKPVVGYQLFVTGYQVVDGWLKERPLQFAFIIIDRL